MINQLHCWAYTQRDEVLISKRYSHLMFLATRFSIANIRDQLRGLPVHDWMKTAWYIYRGLYHSAMTKKSCPCSNIDGTGEPYVK